MDRFGSAGLVSSLIDRKLVPLLVLVDLVLVDFMDQLDDQQRPAV
jgi:hypothetical protein